ncbi:MAG: hypothetical protein P8Z79_02980 [Sedimentisphaerales bacterium]|jgi:hypothetical protein
MKDPPDKTPTIVFWAAAAMMALWGSAASFEHLDWPSKWLAISTTLIFAFFTASGSRRGYYILPILSFCALLAALCPALAREAKWRRLVTNVRTGLILPVVVGAIVSPVFGPTRKERLEFMPPTALALGTSLLGVVAIACFVLGRWSSAAAAQLTGGSRELAPLIMTSVVVMGGFFCWPYNVLSRGHPLKSFSTELKAEVPGLEPGDVGFFRKIPYEMLFYLSLPAPVRFLNTQEDARDFIASSRPAKVLVSHEWYADELANVLGADVVDSPTLTEKTNPWERHKERYVAWIVRRAGK